MSDISIYWWILLIVALVVGPLGLMIWLRFGQKRHRADLQHQLVYLQITVPKESGSTAAERSQSTREQEQLIAPMEQLFSTLGDLGEKPSWLEWLFSDPDYISLEIIAVNGHLSFALVVPKKFRSQVERQIQSFYPTAEIVAGRPPTIFADHQAIAGAVFSQTKNFVLPIVTYRQLDIDPLSTLTNSLTKLSGGAVVQLLVRPINDSWRKHTRIASGHVQEDRAHMINRSPLGRVVKEFSTATKTKEPNEAPKPMSEEQQNLLEMLERKGSKSGFEVALRVVVAANDPAAARADLQTIVTGFAQYNTPVGNSLRFRLQTNEQVAKDYLTRRFGKAPKMILNTEELASIWHLPHRLLETPGVKWLVARRLPPPVNLPEKGVVIGRSVFRGASSLVRLDEEDRRRHLFMIGKTGVGKTTIFETMIEQDIHQGRGLCFIDPLGDAIVSIMKKIPTHRANDVILFDPSDTSYPLGLNLLEWNQPREKDFLIQEVIEIFYKLFDPNRTGIVGPQWEHWARNAALTVMSLPGGGTLIDIPKLFMDDAFRARAIEQVSDPIVRSFWKEQLAKTADFHKSEMYNYFISKFGRFMTNDLMRGIIGQQKSSFNFRSIMDEGKILLVNLSKGKIGDINANLLGLVLVAKLQAAAFSRADQPEEQRRDFYLYVDEFQNFATKTFATILSEARKYRLSLNLTNQYFAQLSEEIQPAIIGNVGTLIAFRVGADDAEFLVKELPGVTVEDLTNLDRFQAYTKLLIDLAPTKPFSLESIKSPNIGSQEMANWLVLASRSKFSASGRPNRQAVYAPV
ncbi:MAG: TraM recognition domain-containing protein [Patescibacteria group bacterium]|mgnify:FL=1